MVTRSFCELWQLSITVYNECLAICFEFEPSTALRLWAKSPNLAWHCSLLGKESKSQSALCAYNKLLQNVVAAFAWLARGLFLNWQQLSLHQHAHPLGFLFGNKGNSPNPWCMYSYRTEWVSEWVSDDDDDDNLLIYMNPLGAINHIGICMF